MAKSFFETEHPKEMYLLALAEMCQRFAFWGIAYLLVFYLVDHFHLSEASADQAFGLFTGVSFILPILGGWIADRTSHQGSVLWGSLLNATACFLMTIGSLPFICIALFFAAAGSSLFTPGIYSILGRVYHNKHQLREGGFSLYYCAVNVGIFLAMIILGSIGQAQAWTFVFLVAGIVQLLGLIPFFCVMKSKELLEYKQQALTSPNQPKTPAKLKKIEKDRIVVICVLALFTIFFWTAFNQGGSSMNFFALHYTDRSFFGFKIPPSWLLSLESLYLVLFVFPITAFYVYLAKRKKDPSPPVKSALGLLAIGLSFLVMVVGALQIPSGASTAAISPGYLVFAYALMALGEMLISPIGLSLVTHLSPHRYTAMLVGVWYFCIGIGFYAGGMLAGLMSKLSSLSAFFSIYVAMTFLAAVLLLALSKKLNLMRHAATL